jgi:predicted secreted protein
MTKKNLIFLCILAMLFSNSLARAGSADFRPIGLSKDGKVFIFEEFGADTESDGFSAMHFIDIKKNTPLTEATITFLGSDVNTHSSIDFLRKIAPT